ncbi:ABC transporter ATP-binding protein [Dehalogenimonas etheniformans]|uniref:ABC transporter ATP-binding protein n=1 Tax=Dehalogenimonas etheniformans TaxID=1536648 RepID=A0A2P5P886_9CHLR|nr:ABC transporter ATP-binding protein [Dehalogenimonas etheniformans]PPD58504.1 ABC transporter ATP-binding protein [Dehalogenimonas etheniformans]QNT76732.1 ABC transporter ATP-binding protein [Dehalogenimonas etheniformans]
MTPEISPHLNGDVILRTSGLTKYFGTLAAVKNLNLELRKGEVFGFLGPNGAGKSTTVGMLLNLIAPTAGEIEIFGLKLEEHRWPILRRIGAIIEEPAFYPYLSGWDNLEALSKSIGDVPLTKIKEVLERVNLFDRSRDRYQTYSMGMKQRLGIAAALLRDPELIILDEPTNGLDPAGTKEIRDLIPELAHENRAVFLCSHLLHEVELVCDRVAIIKKGNMIANAQVRELLTTGQVLQVRVVDSDITAASDVLKNLPWIHSVKSENGYLVVDAPKESGAQVNKALAEKNIFASEIVPHVASLEDIFLELTGGESHD